MQSKIINYNKKSNYFHGILIFLLILFAYFSKDMRIGTYLETILLYISIGILMIVLNSNKMFSSFTYGKLKNYSIGSGELKNYQIETLESNYFIYILVSFSFVSFNISYLLLKYSKLVYSFIPFVLAILFLFGMVNYIRNKKKIIAKSKQINANIQDTILVYFGTPLHAYWVFFLFVFPHLSSNSRWYGIIVLGIYAIISIYKGTIEIIKLKKQKV